MPSVKRPDHLLPSASQPYYFHKGNRSSDADSEDNFSSTDTGSDEEDTAPISTRLKSNKASAAAAAGSGSPSGSISGLESAQPAIPKRRRVVRKRKAGDHLRLVPYLFSALRLKLLRIAFDFSLFF